MKNNIYFLIALFLISLLFLLPSLSFAQSLAPIPEVGEGVCVSNCPKPTPTPFSLPDFSFGGSPSEDTDITSFISPAASEVLQTVEDDLQNVSDLDNEALQKLEERDYPSLPPIINDAVELLTETRETLKTDPELRELREHKPKEVSKIDRSLKSSINNHKRALSTVNQINNNPKVKEDEGLLARFLKKAKKFLTSGRRYAHTTSVAVAGVRG